MIENFKFGEITVDGNLFKRDIQIKGEKATPWISTKKDTLLLEDAENLIKGLIPKVVIIGTGTDGMFRITREAKAFLQEQEIELIIKPTQMAIKEINRLEKEGTPYSALVHIRF